MPSYYDPWDDDEQRQQYDESSFYGGDDSDFSIWKPGDPDSYYSPTMPERSSYRRALGVMASNLSPNIAGFAEAVGPTGYGADYAPAHLRWTGQGSYQPKGRIGLGVWGHDQGLNDPFPILGGKIITPTLDIFTRDREQHFDEYGRAIDEREYQPRADFRSGRVEVANIMQTAGTRGRSVYEQMIAEGMTQDEARLAGERASHGSVRSQTSSFPSEDFGQRWGWPQGLRSATSGAVNMRLHGEYGIGSKDLFKVLGEYDLFTRTTSPSVDDEHPERGAWQAYKLDTLYSLGWLQSEGGSFITGTNKPDKRRQLGVQRLAAPIGADAFMRTGRLTGDRMLNTTAVFMENYPYSEGSGVADPTLVSGFRNFRPRTIERPAQAGEDWKVRFGIKDEPGPLGKPGESVFLGEQFVGGEWRPLGDEPGKPGVQQRVFGYRKTQSGYQALIESISPFESGTAKVMHHGMKALLFQSSAIINRMQGNVREAQALGQLPMDVEAPRMVLPMSKDWMQTYKGMFDFLPEETLRGMGISETAIQSRNWQKVGPEAIDKLSQYVQQRRFSFEQVHEVPVSRLGAFENAGNIVNGVEYLQKGGVDFARFTAQHTGYALPIAAGIRIEYPGKAPMYSPEEMMQLQRLYPQLAQRLANKANPASRIWGTAVAAAEGAVPQGVVSHEDLPWVSARLNIEGSFDDAGTARTLVENLAREMKERKQLGAIMGPGGTLLPNPNDVMSQSIMDYSGQEQSQFTASYIRAMKLMGTGEDATKALTEFSGHLQSFAAGHNVRRKALGATLNRAVEGTFTSHMAIPDDMVVAGNDALRTLLGIRGDDTDAEAKFTEAVRMIEGGQNFYALGTRRPVSDMFNQLGVTSRIITERMARDVYGAEIENLGRSFAVSPTMAAVWRGDVDADRALLHAVTDVRYKGTEVNMPGGNETWYTGGVSFNTSDEILGAHNQQTLMARQVAALRTRAPGAYNEWATGQSEKSQGLLEAGLQGDRGIEATRVLSKALHGIDIDWNESKKWSDELAVGTGKNLPQNYAYYADPSHGTVFSKEQMLGKFEQQAKSKELMGRGYNRYLRGLTSMARSEDELQAAVTLASNVYQKALDNQKMTSGELALFNMMESIGATGAMYDKFDKEQGYVSSAFAGGPAGMMAMLASAVTDMDVPREALGTLFSRDPNIAKVVASGGNALDIIRAVGLGGNEVANSRAFLEDPERAGILPQMVQALHFSKKSMADVNLNPAETAYAAQGQRIRDLIDVTGGSARQKIKNAQGEDIEISGLAPADAARKMRNMAGLDSMPWWRRNMAGRMGLNPLFFASDEEVDANVPSFDTGPGGWDKLPSDLRALAKQHPFWLTAQGVLSYENSLEFGVSPRQLSPSELLFAGHTELLGNQGATRWDAFRDSARSLLKTRKSWSLPEFSRVLDNLGRKEFKRTGGVNYADMPSLSPMEGEMVFDNMLREFPKARLRNRVSPLAAIAGRDYGTENHRPPSLYDPPLVDDWERIQDLPSFANPTLGGEEFKAFISEKEANVLEGLRQMPAGQAQQIAAAISQPARYTPKSGAPSFETGSEGWDKFTGAPEWSSLNEEQRKELWRMKARNQPDDAIVARMQGFASQMSIANADRGPDGATFASGPAPAPDPEPMSESVFSGGSSIEDATGRAIAHEVYAGFGGRPAFEAAIQSIRQFKKNRPEGGPLIPQDRLTRRAVNEIVQRGGGEAGMFEWQKIMGQFGVGFAPQMENSPEGPQKVWSHSYGSMPAGGAGPTFDMPEGMLSEEQIGQLRSSISRALSGAEIDPTTFVGGIASNFMKVLQERGEFDTQSVVPLMPIFQQLLGYGDEMEIWQRMYGPQNMQTRIKLQPQGLKGHAKELLMNMVEKGMTQGYSPEVMGLMEQGYKHSAIGQGMVRSVRDIMDTNVEGLDMKRSWGMWEDVQKVKGALGEDAPEALIDKMDELGKHMSELTDVQKEHLKRAKDRLDADPRYQSAMGLVDTAAMASAANAPMNFTDEQVKRIKAVRGLRAATDLPTDEIDRLLGEHQMEELLTAAGKGIGSKSPGRFGTAVNKLIGRPDGAPAMGSADIGNMFTELTLGWTAFRMRMAWNLATGAQKDWQNAFMGEEGAAIGAALAGGAPAGNAGASSRYLSANAAIANTKASLGEGVAQVYAPFMSTIGQLGGTSGFGAAATIGGTSLGGAFLSAMGANMFGTVLPTIGAAAGPIGMMTGGAITAALTASYIKGEAPEWVRYDPGSKEENWRKAARVGELAMNEKPGGMPAWYARLIGAAGGKLGLQPNDLFGGSALSDIKKEKDAWVPGTLSYDADALRDWAQERYKNRVPTENALGLMGSLFQITGRTAEEVYSGKATDFAALMDRYVSYMEGGASPEGLFTAQAQTVGYAGVPLGPQSEAWMLQFAQNVPGQQRQMYEQAYKGLSAIPSALGRQTTFSEATQVVDLTEKFGSLERAVNQVTGMAGAGWFTSAFGVESGGSTAQMLGTMFGMKDLPAQDTAQRLAGMTASSFARAGVPAGAAGAFISNLAETNRDNVLGMSNLVIQAESVSLQTGQSILSLINQADAAGYSSKSIAEQRWYLASQGGVSGLAPSAFVPTGQQAREFEQTFADLSISQQAAYKTASGMLSQVMPMGFTQQQLSGFSQMLVGGMSVPELGLGLSAMTGRAGLATSMGIPAASPMAQMLEASTIGLPGNLKMTQDQVQGMRGSLSPAPFQYMTGKEKAALGPGLRGMYMDVWAGNMSDAAYGKGVESATGSTPWGMSAQRDFGPGSLTDSLGRPYGMYEPWTATAGRQAGQSFAPLFDLQMNAAYASLGAQSASLPIEHRMFERQQAAKRIEWGTGPFTSLGAVQSAIFPAEGSGTEPAQVGTGMQIGESSIGLVQQEAAIRKQMWQENLAYQMQSIQFQRQSLEIAKQELELSKQQYGAQREHNLSERGANRGMQLRQREWATEDFSLRMERMGTTQQWTMEDLQRSRRYATGRERVDIERNIQRAMVSQGWERDDANRGRSREQEVQRFQDQRYEAAIAFEEKLHALQMQRFGLQEQKLNLQGEMLAAQEAHLLAQAGLQAQLQKIDEERFQYQYEQMQLNLKDEETLEKLRQDARKAELAYQAAQLANAETLQKTQEDWMRELQGIKEGGVLDKWIEFFNAVRAGPPDGKASGGPVSSRTPYLVGERGPEIFVPQNSGTIIPNHQLSIAQDLRAAQNNRSQPVVVNFVLDGEVIMQAVVKPERLRPVVEEISRRGKLR